MASNESIDKLTAHFATAVADDQMSTGTAIYCALWKLDAKHTAELDQLRAQVDDAQARSAAYDRDRQDFSAKCDQLRAEADESRRQHAAIAQMNDALRIANAAMTKQLEEAKRLLRQYAAHEPQVFRFLGLAPSSSPTTEAVLGAIASSPVVLCAHCSGPTRFIGKGLYECAMLPQCTERTRTLTGEAAATEAQMVAAAERRGGERALVDLIEAMKEVARTAHDYEWTGRIEAWSRARGTGR